MVLEHQEQCGHNSRYCTWPVQIHTLHLPSLVQRPTLCSALRGNSIAIILFLLIILRRTQTYIKIVITHSLQRRAASRPCRPKYQAWHRALMAARLAVQQPACMHYVTLARLQHLHPHPAPHHQIMRAARRLKCAANLLAPTQPRRNAMRAKWPATAVPHVRSSTGVSNRTATRPSATCWRP